MFDKATLGACLDRLAELQRQMSRLSAEQVGVLARIGAMTGGPDGIRADLVSCVMNVPLRSAQKQIAIADTLHRNLPATRAALADGTLPVTHAQLIAEAAWDLSVAAPSRGASPSAETDDGTRGDVEQAPDGAAIPPVAQQLETATLERAREQTTSRAHCRARPDLRLSDQPTTGAPRRPRSHQAVHRRLRRSHRPGKPGAALPASPQLQDTSASPIPPERGRHLHVDDRRNRRPGR